MSVPAAQASQQPVWLDIAIPATSRLTGDVTCDVCIVGGGIAGLLVADRLTTLGKRVVVLEQARLARGETGHTTAHFVSAMDDRCTELERMHGEIGARQAAESHMAAIDYVETLIRELGVDCQWKRLDGYLVVNHEHRDEQDKLLEEELAACLRSGLTVDRVSSLPAPWPGELGPALRFARQAQVHPIRLLQAVAARLIARGARIFEQTHATQIHDGADTRVETKDGPVVRCRHIVVATNTPINNLVAVHTKQAGYQTYVMAFRVPAGVFPPALLWDGLWKDDAAYHYVRLLHGATEPGGDDLLIVGGEDHKTGQGPEGDQPYRNLEEWTRKHFPMCGAVERRWSGEVMEPADGLGYIGHNAAGRENVYVVTGDSGNGMTHAAIAAMLIPDQILGRVHPWTGLYDPSRKVGIHALSDYLSENMNTFAQYGDWLSRGDVSDESEIKPGEGAIVVKGLSHLAVYKDLTGVCTRLSATCPHLGGVVRWNGLEKTWDCPCHASRFDKLGRVMHGPANSDLKPHGG